MNEIANKYLLTGNKFRQTAVLVKPGFMYNTCGTFTKNKEIIQNFKEVCVVKIKLFFYGLILL